MSITIHYVASLIFRISLQMNVVPNGHIIPNQLHDHVFPANVSGYSLYWLLHLDREKSERYDKGDTSWGAFLDFRQNQQKIASLCIHLLHIPNSLDEAQSGSTSRKRTDYCRITDNPCMEEKDDSESDSSSIPSSDQDVCCDWPSISSGHRIVSYFCNIGNGCYSPVLVMEPQSCCTLNTSSKVGQRPSRPIHGVRHRVRRNFDRKTKERILNLYLLLLNKNPNMTVRLIAGIIFEQIRKDEWELLSFLYE